MKIIEDMISRSLLLDPEISEKFPEILNFRKIHNPVCKYISQRSTDFCIACEIAGQIDSDTHKCSDFGKGVLSMCPASGSASTHRQSLCSSGVYTETFIISDWCTEEMEK